MKQGLFIHQGLHQTQVLKPQQILVSTLLQLPMLMLEQKIKLELVENPVLEETDELEELEDDEENAITEDREKDEKVEQELSEIEENNKSEDDKNKEEAEDEINVDDLIPDDEDLPEPRIPKEKNIEERDMPERYYESMSESLIQQMHLLNLSEMELKIGEYIIYNIEDNGYLDSGITLDTIAEIFKTTPETVEKVLKEIQKLDPVGIGARNLQECLLVQLEVKNDKGYYNLPIRILKECYHDYTNKRYEKVLEALDITLEEIKDAKKDIEQLNPKPGEGFLDTKLNYIIPDFFVKMIDKKLMVSLNEYNTPGLRINHYYKKLARQPRKLVDKEVRKFLKDKIESAKWFIKAIQQRKVTMQKTMDAIVDKQRDFFIKGPENIKPMIMKDIAEAIEMDISTVSRVCKGKYVDTDYGVFSLKYFFNEGMENLDGHSVSTIKIKERLKEIISNEEPSKPLSDDKLAKMFTREGVPIARRTVAKYREQLDIPVARLRRNI